MVKLSDSHSVDVFSVGGRRHKHQKKKPPSQNSDEDGKSQPKGSREADHKQPIQGDPQGSREEDRPWLAPPRLVLPEQISPVLIGILSSVGMGHAEPPLLGGESSGEIGAARHIGVIHNGILFHLLHESVFCRSILAILAGAEIF